MDIVPYRTTQGTTLPFTTNQLTGLPLSTIAWQNPNHLKSSPFPCASSRARIKATAATCNTLEFGAHPRRRASACTYPTCLVFGRAPRRMKVVWSRFCSGGWRRCSWWLWRGICVNRVLISVVTLCYVYLGKDIDIYVQTQERESTLPLATLSAMTNANFNSGYFCLCQKCQL